MLISHERKLAFFRNPKAGSTTMQVLIHMIGFKDGDLYSGLPHFGLDQVGYLPAHGTPAQAIDEGYITLDQLREYDVYANIRDPLRRQVSAFRYEIGGSPDEFREFVLAGTSLGPILEMPQTEYFTVHGERIARPIVTFRELGGNFATIPMFNKQASVDVDTYLDPEVRAILKIKHAADIRLHKELTWTSSP